ncbi:MAG: hypothetical protein M3O35_05600 [Acidobacteriota bacterium]|nr:hypothetical protein [Acidobacteriota bacterium]
MLQVPLDQHAQQEWLPQIEEYGKELKVLARTYRFDLYCEEIKHSAFSFAEHLAIDRRKRYVNIDMPKEIRLRLGIPLDYASPNVTTYTDQQILAWHHIRENYMFERATDRMNPATAALVICGDEHLEPLAQRFRELGGRVQADSILQRPWYRPELFTIEYYL